MFVASRKEKARSGLTLLELTMVIFIVGILSAIGVVSFVKMVEKSRTAEAKKILGQIRTAERSYYLDNATYTTSIDMLGVGAPTGCASMHYFFYSISAATDSDFTAVATRCTASGKVPDSTQVYDITVDLDGTWSGSAGYY